MRRFFGFTCLDHYDDLIVFPKLSESEALLILSQIEICPEKYYNAKSNFDAKMSTGRFSNFLDELVFYNLQDCEILHKALVNYDKSMVDCFNVRLLSKLSLPALSEHIPLTNFSEEYGHVFSFGDKFGHLNEKIRAGLLGGPTVCFHRHCEINSVDFDDCVRLTPSGEPYKKFVSYDFNGRIFKISDMSNIFLNKFYIFFYRICHIFLGKVLYFL